jgi:isopentenyl-diphosphate Delta-isomerase
VSAGEQVVLVDEHDRELGVSEKLRAHRDGALHRALSVFVFDDDDRLLLQRRAAGKYHSGGEWTNTCCSHPRPGEPVDEAARRRLREEMGIDCPVEKAFEFMYREDVGGGLIEHELDHVFVGRWSGEPRPDPAEADGWRWLSLAEAAEDASAHPERYTAWFRLIATDAEMRRRLVESLPENPGQN